MLQLLFSVTFKQPQLNFLAKNKRQVCHCFFYWLYSFGLLYFSSGRIWSTVLCKSLVRPPSPVIFCFNDAGLSCNFNTWQWISTVILKRWWKLCNDGLAWCGRPHPLLILCLELIYLLSCLVPLCCLSAIGRIFDINHFFYLPVLHAVKGPVLPWWFLFLFLFFLGFLLFRVFINHMSWGHLSDTHESLLFHPR